MWARGTESGEGGRAGCVNLPRSRGQGDFVSGLKDGKLGRSGTPKNRNYCFLDLVLRAFCFFGRTGSAATMSLMDVRASAL